MPTLHHRRSTAEVDADTRATALIDAMAALPQTHPDRPVLREQAIEAWMPMAARLARRYANRGEAQDDLNQAAAIGLIKSVDGFDPERGSDFASYAIPTILGEVRRHFRDRAWSMRIPRRLQELRIAISAAQADLTHDLRRPPTAADVATRLGVSEEEVLEALESGHAYRAIPLSTPTDDDTGRTVGDKLGYEEHGYELAELSVTLPPAMAVLDERERQIVLLRFYGNHTQQQIADQIGVSQMHISRLLTRALAKMRTHLS